MSEVNVELIKQVCDIWNPAGEAKAAFYKEYTDKKTGKLIKGYYPECKYKFNKQAGCKISKGVEKPCIDCPIKEYDVVGVDFLTKNANGQKDRIGIYPMTNKSQSHWIAADFDNKDGQKKVEADVLAVGGKLKALEIPFSLFKSKSGAGYHIYLFFDELVSARKSRSLMFWIFESAGVEIVSGTDKDGSFDKIFPNQDALLYDDQIGNLIAIPWHGKSFRENGGSCFVNSESLIKEGDSIEENIEMFLEYYETMSKDDLDGYIKEFGIKPKTTASASKGAPNNINHAEKLNKLVDNCEFLKFCRDNSGQVTEPQWHAMICSCVREYGGPVLIHQLSKGYSKYTYEETDRKILQVLNSSPGPITCSYIKSVFDCGKSCGVTCPTHLLYSSQNRVNQSEIAWLSDVLMGVEKGERTRTARRLAGFYLTHSDLTDEQARNEQVISDLEKWNVFNKPPLESNQIYDLFHQSQERHGIDTFSNSIGVDISHLERLEYPDGDVIYQLFVKDISTSAKLKFKDFCSGKKFQEMFGELINSLIKIPTGKGSIEQWMQLINPFLADAMVVQMPEEETDLTVLRDKIKASVDLCLKAIAEDKYSISKGGVSSRSAFIKDDKVVVWVTQLHTNLKKEKSDLCQYSRKELCGMLKKLEFEFQDKNIKIGQSVTKVWIADVKKFK